MPIATGYRTGIKFERLLQSCKPNAEKLQEAIGLYFRPGTIRPEEMEAAVDAIVDFYRCGEPRPARKEGGEQEGPPPDPVFDYEHDGGYIYAAFKQTYGVDLTTENIHWWQFRALFKALPEDTMFIKIVGYRTAKVPPKATAEQRQRIEELKRLYALPLSADQQKLTTDLEQILLNGGNPAALLGQEGADAEWHTMEP